MSAEKKSAWILGFFVVTEGAWCALNLVFSGWHFFRYLGFASGRAGAGMGWAAALVVVIIFVAFACRLPSVRANLVRPSFLKLLAIALAVVAGILEEVMFRKWVMDALDASGYGAGIQIVGSALTFGAVHAIWGLMGKSPRAAAGAMLATSFFGRDACRRLCAGRAESGSVYRRAFSHQCLYRARACPGCHSGRDGAVT